MAASDSAKSRMERVLRLHEQIDAIKLDIRQVYAEEKADGGDKTAMGAAVSYIRKRDKEGSDLADREAMADVYVAAYDAPRAHTHTRESQSYADQKGRGVEVEVDTPHDAETGEIIENQESPSGKACGDGHTSGLRNLANKENGHVDRSAERAIDEQTDRKNSLDGLTSLAAREGDKPLHSNSNSDATAPEPEANGLSPRAANLHSDAAPPPAASEQPEADPSSPASGAHSAPQPILPDVPPAAATREAGAVQAAASPSSSDEPPLVGRHIEMPDIPAFLRRDHAGVPA